MNIKYLKLVPIVALMASVIFFASVSPSLAQIPTYYHDIKCDDCKPESGLYRYDLGPVWRDTGTLTDTITTQTEQLQFLSPPPIQW